MRFKLLIALCAVALAGGVAGFFLTGRDAKPQRLGATAAEKAGPAVPGTPDPTPEPTPSPSPSPSLSPEPTPEPAAAQEGPSRRFKGSSTPASAPVKAAAAPTPTPKPGKTPVPPPDWWWKDGKPPTSTATQQ